MFIYMPQSSKTNMSDQCSSICPNQANTNRSDQCSSICPKMNKPKLKYFMHFPYPNSTSDLFLDIDNKKTPKDPDVSDSSLPDIQPPGECSRPLCQSPRKKTKPVSSPKRHPASKSPLRHSPRKHATTPQDPPATEQCTPSTI